jgi:hypothetical protein
MRPQATGYRSYMDVFTCEQKLLAVVRKMSPADVAGLKEAYSQLADAIDALVEADLEKLSSGWEEE